MAWGLSCAAINVFIAGELAEGTGILWWGFKPLFSWFMVQHARHWTVWYPSIQVTRNTCSFRSYCHRSVSLTVALDMVTVVVMHGLTFTFFQPERLSTLLPLLSFCTTLRSRCNDTTSDTRMTSNRTLS